MNNGMTSPIHDEYDRRAYERLRDELSREPSAIRRASGRVGGAVGSAVQAVHRRLPHRSMMAPNKRFGLHSRGCGRCRLILRCGVCRSRRCSAAINVLATTFSPSTTYKILPLRAIDDVIPGLRWRYSLVAGVEGAGAGIVITGGELVATAGSVASAGAAPAPGAGTVIGAMAFDAATVLAASARVVAHTAAYYGYDVRLPEEELYALTIINWSSATSEGAKYCSLSATLPNHPATRARCSMGPTFRARHGQGDARDLLRASASVSLNASSVKQYRLQVSSSEPE